MKFLFGQVVVNVAIVDAEDQKAAKKIFKCPPDNQPKDAPIEKATFLLVWTEMPGDNAAIQRDQVLASFLHLMQKQIPFTPDAKPSMIIVPPPGAITMVEKTKIKDHESCTPISDNPADYDPFRDSKE